MKKNIITVTNIILIILTIIFLIYQVDSLHEENILEKAKILVIQGRILMLMVIVLTIIIIAYNMRYNPPKKKTYGHKL